MDLLTQADRRFDPRKTCETMSFATENGSVPRDVLDGMRIDRRPHAVGDSHRELSRNARRRVRPYLEEPMSTHNAVTETPAAPSDFALAHFGGRLTYETDCWDVSDAMRSERPGFVLADVRSPQAIAKGHIPGAINIPHPKITAESLTKYPVDTLFVVYCAGPHCNGANKAALRLARLRRPVKEMIGGVEGWTDEGFELAN
jgi:rhodanese-related sulfurtransferase